ncbi:MAG: ABC transporter ATP-binding protein [Planctomycetes bacterium]|nr:ABC transporter ATP-binding protein [Planctomycetota bacterium]
MLVVTNGLTKRYGALTALADCSLEVGAGEVFGLLGPNGSGKTTLLRLLLGFLRPTAGQATIDGLNCYAHSVAVHRRVAYLPGEARLPRRLRGHTVLRYFCSLRPDGNVARAVEIAQRLGLDLSRQVARCSTGMRQMLALCIAMSADVPLVILDEPTSSLDPTVRAEVAGLVREARAAGRTVIFSSHVLSEVEEVCDRVSILRQGHVVHQQTLAELTRQHRIRARLTAPIGPPPKNIASQIGQFNSAEGRLEIVAPGELAPLLGWLSTLPIDEVQIEPLGLRTVYDRFHREAVDG